MSGVCSLMIQNTILKQIILSVILVSPLLIRYHRILRVHEHYLLTEETIDQVMKP